MAAARALRRMPPGAQSGRRHGITAGSRAIPGAKAEKGINLAECRRQDPG
jgi:hypothetical protein